METPCKSLKVLCVALAHPAGDGRCVVHAGLGSHKSLGRNDDRARQLAAKPIEPPPLFRSPWAEQPHWTERYA